MLWNLFKPSGILGVVTAIGAVFLAVVSISAYIRDDAISDNNREWELKIAKKNQELHNRIGEQNLKLMELEKKLVEADQALAAATDLNRKALEKQRVSIPLSEACTACRIPNERLWLRKPTRVGLPGDDLNGGQAAGGQPGSEAPAKEANLPGPGEKGLYGPRAGIGSGLLGGLRNNDPR